MVPQPESRGRRSISAGNNVVSSGYHGTFLIVAQDEENCTAIILTVHCAKIVLFDSIVSFRINANVKLLLQIESAVFTFGSPAGHAGSASTSAPQSKNR
jgi:hypothetical protein